MNIRKTSAGDYRVAFIGEKDEYAIYEEYVDDAVSTAKKMFEWRYTGMKKYWVC